MDNESAEKRNANDYYKGIRWPTKEEMKHHFFYVEGMLKSGSHVLIKFDYMVDSSLQAESAAGVWVLNIFIDDEKECSCLVIKDTKSLTGCDHITKEDIEKALLIAADKYIEHGGDFDSIREEYHKDMDIEDYE